MIEKRNIKTVAPFLADDFIDLDESSFDIFNYSSFLNKNSRRLGTFKKYLICKLHDSLIIDTKQDNDNFIITLNDFSTYVFADAIINKYNLPIDSNNISFPLTIKLAGNIKVEFFKIDDDGNLIEIDPIKIDEYLYEQVTHLDQEKIEIAFHFWKSNLKEDKPGDRIIVLVSAEDLIITENQDKAWTELFGDKYNSLYIYFKEQFDSDRYVSDNKGCETIIAEFEKINNK